MRVKMEKLKIINKKIMFLNKINIYLIEIQMVKMIMIILIKNKILSMKMN
jgi:hypothetical protein